MKIYRISNQFVLWHGSPYKFEKFNVSPDSPVYFTAIKEDAIGFAKDKAEIDEINSKKLWIIKAKVNISNCFDYTNMNHIDKLMKNLVSFGYGGMKKTNDLVFINTKQSISEGHYLALEDVSINIYKLGFDSYRTKESNAVAVFNPSCITILEIYEIKT